MEIGETEQVGMSRITRVMKFKRQFRKALRDSLVRVLKLLKIRQPSFKCSSLSWWIANITQISSNQSLYAFLLSCDFTTSVELQTLCLYALNLSLALLLALANGMLANTMQTDACN